MSELNALVRTTIVFTNEDRELIKASGKTINDFFSDLLQLYKKMSINNWADGSYIVNEDRYCFINQRNLNQLIKNSKIDDIQEIGRIIGNGFRESLLPQNPNLTMEDLAEHLEKILRWGRICLQNNNQRIVLRDPIISNADFNKNLLESFFAIRLEVSDPNAFRQVFELKD